MKRTTGKKATDDFPKKGEVYWVNFDPSFRTEIQKTRPAVILSNNMFNRNLPRVIIAPLTSNVKQVFDFHCLVNVLDKEGKILLDQLRTVDKARLGKKITELDDFVIRQLEDALKLTFDLI